MAKKKRKPSKTDLEVLVYGLPLRFFLMLPYDREDRYELVKEIIELWEKIRGAK